MWRLDQISIEIEDAEGDLAIINIVTPSGTVDLIGIVQVAGGVLTVRDAHIQGLFAGRLGRSGLNAIGRKLLVVSDVRQIIIYGASRSTGSNKGRRPRAIIFPAHGETEP